MPSLYVTVPGSRVELEHGRLLSVLREEVLASVPSARVDRVLVVGGVSVTSPALAFLLDRGIDLVFLTVDGRVRGRLDPGQGGHLALRRQQYRRSEEPAFCLAVGRAVIDGKIANARTRCMELDTGGDGESARAIERLRTLRSDLPKAPDLASLMGIEGSAARIYFGVLRRHLREPWTFSTRVRRPPPDPVNAVLSVAYTLLQEQCRTALVAVGLDPECGFLHAERPGRPALALDLMEEFRPVVADPVAWTLFNRRMLSLEDFRPAPDGRGIHLTAAGWNQVATEYTRRIETGIRIPDRVTKTTYRKLLEVQAWQMRRVMEGEQEAYRPFLQR